MRRSGRERPQKTAAAIPASVQRGLRSFLVGREETVASMLDVDTSSDLYVRLTPALAAGCCTTVSLLLPSLPQPTRVPLLAATVTGGASGRDGGEHAERGGRSRPVVYA